MRDFRQHLLRIQEAGCDWVRLDAKKPLSRCKEVFKEAHDLNINVLCVITSKNMLSGLGFGNRYYFPGSDWSVEWKARVRSVTEELGDYVKIWQMDNELNHPWHNFLPSLNRGLAIDIVEKGIDVVREINSKSRIAVNLFFRRKGVITSLYFPNDRPLIRKYKDKLEEKIDILGMDIYRGTWHSDDPSLYHDDLARYHDLWGGDIMIMETGYCLESFGHTPEGQIEHVENVFDAIESHCKDSPWFSGMFWYEYHSRHEGLPCEEFFGLHGRDGIIEKPAWRKFGEKITQFKRYNKIFGITYHY